MWTSYSARHAAQLIGLAESAVRSCIKDGLVGAPGAVPAALTFRDLAALRTVKALVEAGIPLVRVRRELVRLRDRYRTSLSELTVELRDGAICVRGAAVDALAAAADDADAAEPPAQGQLALPFARRPATTPPPPLPPPAEIRELPRPADAPNPIPAIPATAEQWLHRATSLEERDPVAAIDAYRRSLRLRPECAEAWINLGRLFAESGDASAAKECFASAIELDPDEATAFYNLGVLAQDAGSEAEAIAHYHRALELDAQLAEAHYNLATLFDQSGDSRAAIRHINEYRKLTK